MEDWLTARVRVTPDKIAFIDQSAFAAQWLKQGKISYAELQLQVEATTQELYEVGIRRGMHVGVLMPNSIFYVIRVFALQRLGAVLVPLNARLTLDELDYQLQKAECQFVLVHTLDNTGETLKQRGHRVLQNRDFEALYEWSSSMEEPPIEELDLNATAAIVFTSGTSGKPKGAMLTYGNFFYSAMASAVHLGVMPHDHWLCVLPLYHVGGLSILYRACLSGITVELHEKFDVEKVNEALTQHPVTHVSLVPTMLYRLLEAKKEAWNPALRCVLLGGAAASPELLARCQAENIPVYTTYGLTEAASQVATGKPHPLPPLRWQRGGLGEDNSSPLLTGERLGEGGFAERVALQGAPVGTPLLFTQVEVQIPETGGTIGEVVVRGLTVMQGYYHDPEATAKTLREGALYTGDLGYWENGELHIVQRRSDLILSGGENVYPAEVETILKQHPAVQEAAVVGLADPEWGQRVAAAVILHAGSTLASAELTAYCRAHLAGYKVPRAILFVPELPQTASGKIQRPAVQALFKDFRQD